MTLRGRDIIDIVGKKIYPDFNLAINNDLGNTYQLLYEYLFSKNSKLSRGKGIVLYGNEGTGKSLAMKIVRDLIIQLGTTTERRFTIVNYEDIVREYRDINNEIFELYGHGKDRDICFDDFLNLENRQRSDYGTVQAIADLLIRDRYNCFIQKGLLTHITTNQTPESLSTILSPSAMDRMYEMFHFINMSGVSLRKKQFSGNEEWQ